MRITAAAVMSLLYGWQSVCRFTTLVQTEIAYQLSDDIVLYDSGYPRTFPLTPP